MGNAKNWMHTTRIILEEHYELRIQETWGELMSLIEEDWCKPFEMAKGWATRSMGQRLKRETITWAETLLQEATDIASEMVGDNKATREQKRGRPRPPMMRTSHPHLHHRGPLFFQQHQRPNPRGLEPGGTHVWCWTQ